MNALLISNLVLWVIVLGLCLVVLGLARQVGILHERIAPVGALLLKQGLKVGEAAPRVTVTDLDGRVHTIGSPAENRRSTLLVFVSPTCPICKALLPVFKSTRRGENGWLNLILASDGAEEEHRSFASQHGLTGIPYVLSAELGITYQISRLPYAAIVDAAGILRARGLINSREHLESLFEAQRRGGASMQELFESRSSPRAA